MYSKKTTKIIYLLLIFFITNNISAKISEYGLKTIYIERICRFVDWRESSKNKPTDFTIIVIGKNQFDSKLENFFKLYKIKNKIVKIKYIKNLSNLKRQQNYQLLFISKSMRYKLSKILNIVKSKPILTISDSNGFASKGVHINFYMEKNKLRYELNQQALKKSKLKVSYMLMQQAKITNYKK